MRVLLLSADQYSLTNETTGELLQGTTLFYLNDYREDGKLSLGYKPTKISASTQIFDAIKRSAIQLPALADIEITTRPGAAGKATLVAVSCNPVESVTLF